MSKHISRQIIAERAIVKTGLETVPEADRSFNLPTGLYITTAGLYFAFLAIMAVGFSSPGLIVPMGIFVIFLTAFFGLAALFVKIDPAAKSKIIRWSQLRSQGIDTYTGRLSMKDTIIQMLILPVLIVMWGLAVTLIAALV
ncbi:hypothetical protein [Pontixanthobacter aquaemixtae]|uniref:Uncharacterized protein n=1 Tax=Pontixanthobacter aquaemixtae TaxID=1958940 RepID=A0A844ZRV6_9SPHN|nr:hypothetical protein [Pontixanthobacter aquaemixtae]MXO89736.1 hypothetical protein [Pontixanthobacter aquaemixtae]